jgi:hypothetical protein
MTVNGMPLADNTAGDVGSAAVAIAPERVPEQHDVARARLIVAGLEAAPEHRPHTERAVGTERQLCARKSLGMTRRERQVVTVPSCTRR